LLTIFTAQALPLLIYGISAATLSKNDITSLSFAYNSIFVKLFNIKHSETIRQCAFYSGHLSFNYLYDYYRLIFLKNLFKRNIITCDRLFDVPDVLEFEQLKINYGICNEDSKTAINNKIWETFSRSIII
jgi:hypothetical protein